MNLNIYSLPIPDDIPKEYMYQTVRELNKDMKANNISFAIAWDIETESIKLLINVDTDMNIHWDDKDAFQLGALCQSKLDATLEEYYHNP